MLELECSVKTSLEVTCYRKKMSFNLVEIYLIYKKSKAKKLGGLELQNSFRTSNVNLNTSLLKFYFVEGLK